MFYWLFWRLCQGWPWTNMPWKLCLAESILSYNPVFHNTAKAPFIFICSYSPSILLDLRLLANLFVDCMNSRYINAEQLIYCYLFYSVFISSIIDYHFYNIMVFIVVIFFYFIIVASMAEDLVDPRWLVAVKSMYEIQHSTGENRNDLK